MSEEKKDSSSQARSTGIVSIAILCSRVLGLVRDQLLNGFFGSAFTGIFTAAFFGITATASVGSSPMVTVACIAAAMVACAALGMTIERLAYRPVRHAPKLTPLVTAIGDKYTRAQSLAAAWNEIGRAHV